MSIRPLGDRIVIKCIDAEDTTESGIVIPDNAKEKPEEAVVVAVGRGALGANGEIQPIDVEVGDRVLFNRYSGAKVKIEGVEHLIISEDDALGVVR